MAENRDYILARLTEARSNAQATIDGIDACVDLFMDPDEDSEGDQRREAMDIILDTSGDTSRLIEQAQAGMDKLSADELQEGTGDDDEDEDEED